MARLKSQQIEFDPIKALVIERKLAYRISDAELAQKIGVSRQTYSEMMNHKHTDDWSIRKVKLACKAVRITVDELRSAVRYR